MFGKVLLLALVCVAASEVVEDNLSTIIEGAVNETRNIHDRTALTLHSALDVYYDNDQAILDTVREQVEMLEGLIEKDIETVKASSEKLVRLATQAHAKEPVFECISSRTEKAVQDLNNAVANSDKTISQMGETKREELFRLAYGLFAIRGSLFFHDNFFNTTEEIRACTTPECVQDIVDRYTKENDKICAEVKAFVPKLNMNLEKSKMAVKNTLITVKKDINKVKGAGMSAMKACLLKRD